MCSCTHVGYHTTLCSACRPWSEPPDCGLEPDMERDIASMREFESRPGVQLVRGPSVDEIEAAYRERKAKA